MGSIQEKFFKTLNDEEFLNHIDRKLNMNIKIRSESYNLAAYFCILPLLQLYQNFKVL